MMEKMTKSEKQVMDLLWKSDRPLSCTEIVQLSPDKTWRDSYVHSLLKSLMKKGIVKIEAFELVSRSYARKFAPACSFEHYHMHSSFTDEELADPEVLKNFLKAALDKIERIEDVNRIEEILHNSWRKRAEQ